uniref:Uncharacterized protein n=1 Tax=Coccidioides posadasii RMSCC 3488 TaxID=454284 RepID=A0A0J6F8S4_COCPO|nr:hypothetical protein CPAG_02006 [Coccidioides posadasii RMSCC 3488]
MAALTCPEDDKLNHGSASTRRDPPVESKALYLPTAFQYNVSTDHKLDIAVSPLLLAGALPSPLSFASDTKTFYTAFEVTNISPRSPTFPDSQMPTPLLAFSRGCVHDQDDMQSPVEPPNQNPSARDELPAPSGQDPKNDHKSRRKLADSSKEYRPKTQTPTTSRSSSVSGSRSASRRNQSTCHRHPHSSKTHSSNRRFKLHREERDLVALHRESCRLFESFGVTPKSTSQPPNDLLDSVIPRPTRTSTEPTQRGHATIRQRLPRRNSAESPSSVPLLHSNQPSLSPASSEDLSPNMEKLNHWDTVPPPQLPDDTQPSGIVPAYKVIPPTVMHWTSSSTRRREYEKIDRSCRGIRGMWRRFAPKWCQSKSQRIPFFDETKGGKQLYEGSVRRFRIDIPDEDVDEGQGPQVIESELKAKSGFTKTRILTSDDDSDDSATRHCFGFRRSSKA